MNQLCSKFPFRRCLFDAAKSQNTFTGSRATDFVPNCRLLVAQQPAVHASTNVALLLAASACKSAAARCLQQPPQQRTRVGLARFVSTSSTDLVKDVLIYKYENPKYFKYLNIFACSQFVFWSYMAHFSYSELRDVPVDQATLDDAATSWWRKLNLGEEKYRKGMTVFCLGVGYGILALSWLYTLRSIRFLVLRKGGRDVTMVMYGPFGRNRMMNVPLNCLSAQETREGAKVTMPLKLKGARMYYMLDMRGDFLNTQLFDNTVGLKRKL